jgi:AraC-like DNA-binding protein
MRLDFYVFAKTESVFDALLLLDLSSLSLFIRQFKQWMAYRVKQDRKD